MVVLRKCFDILNTVLGEQEICADKVYRPISFCFFTSLREKKVVYNTLTGEVAEITSGEDALLHSDFVNPSEETAYLIKKWYLVPLEHNDIELCDEVRAFVKTFEKHDGIKNYTVFTTTECNARCFYCYEAGCKKVTMDEKTALATANYIIENAPRDKKVNITWFGGEPLINVAAIDTVSDKLLCAGIDFSARIISNGYLLDTEIIEKAVFKWKVKTVQITLDGTEEVYNSVKAFKCADNAFARVADNIEKLLERGVFVSIRINLSDENKDDLYRLADWLAARYLAFENLSVYPRAMMSYTSCKGEYMTGAKELLDFEAYCSLRGLNVSLRPLSEGIKANSCMADSPSSLTVLPDGHIGKCEHFTSTEFVGDVSNGVDREKLASFTKKANCEALCKGCELYPICLKLCKCPDTSKDVCNSDYIRVERAHLSQSINKKFS